MQLISTIQEVRNELKGLEAINSFVFDPAIIDSTERDLRTAGRYSGPASAFVMSAGQVRDNYPAPMCKSVNAIVNATGQGTLHTPACVLSSKQKRAEHIRSALAPKLSGQQSADILVPWTLMSKPGFEYAGVSARALSSRQVQRSNIGLRVPVRPQTSRPEHNVDLSIGNGTGASCIVNSLRVHNARLVREESDNDANAAGDQFKRFAQSPTSPRMPMARKAKPSPRSSRHNLQSSNSESHNQTDLLQGLESKPSCRESSEVPEEDQAQRPTTASAARTTNSSAPLAAQPRPFTANTYLNAQHHNIENRRRTSAHSQAGPAASHSLSVHSYVSAHEVKLESPESRSLDLSMPHQEPYPCFISSPKRRTDKSRPVSGRNSRCNKDDSAIASESILQMYLGVTPGTTSRPNETTASQIGAKSPTQHTSYIIDYHVQSRSDSRASNITPNITPTHVPQLQLNKIAPQHQQISSSRPVSARTPLSSVAEIGTEILRVWICVWLHDISIPAIVCMTCTCVSTYVFVYVSVFMPGMYVCACVHVSMTVCICVLCVCARV